MPATVELVTERTALINLAHKSCAKDFEIGHVTNLRSLSNVLASADCAVDLILIDHVCLSQEKVNVFDLVNTLRLLTSLHMTKPVQTAVLIDKTITVDLLQSVADASPGGLIAVDFHNSNSQLVLEINQILQGQRVMPKKFVDSVLRKKRSAKAKTQPVLTARQNQVLKMICNSGASNKVIARSLKISESTVKLHISSILKKLGVRNRTQLVLYSQREHDRSVT